MTQFIDTHAHIYLDDFAEAREELIQSAKDQQVAKIFMPNIDSSSIADVHQVELDYPGICYAMMGLHPCYV
ncbi:TatD family hydrolase, partial [Saprospiraceae bacterium]|nr:TatD family hydrolase [Saprospiraceae bacterium]